MKKIFCVSVLCIAALLLFASCSNKKEESPSDSIDETTIDSAVEDTTAEKEEEKFDFSSCSVSGRVLLEAKETKKLEGYSDFIMQKDGIVEIGEDGTVTAASDGVTLVACKHDGSDEVLVCCVLPEGITPDVSGSVPELHEAGTSFPFSGSTRNAVISSSNTEVVDIDEMQMLHFLSPGYAVVTVEGVSVPVFHSYIVYEK